MSAFENIPVPTMPGDIVQTDSGEPVADTNALGNLMDLNARREALAAELQDIQNAMQGRRNEAMGELVVMIQNSVENAGFTMLEISDAMGFQPAPKKRGPRKASGPRNYPTYTDPTNPENTYVRGVLPKWFKDGMVAAGLDPADKESRKKFKETLTISNPV